jgi:hypothetical protein
MPWIGSTMPDTDWLDVWNRVVNAGIVRDIVPRKYRREVGQRFDLRTTLGKRPQTRHSVVCFDMRESGCRQGSNRAELLDVGSGRTRNYCYENIERRVHGWRRLFVRVLQGSAKILAESGRSLAL